MAVLQWLVILLFCLHLNVVLIILLMSVLGFVMMPIPPVLDSWTLKRIEQQESQGEKPMRYTFVRMWSSFTTAWFFLCGRQAVGSVRLLYHFYLLPRCLQFYFFLFWQSPEIQKVGYPVKRFHRILRIYFFSGAFAFSGRCLLLGMAVQSANSFMSIVLRSVGGSDSDLGLMLFMAIIGEVPMMLLSGYFHKKIGPRNCFFISIGLYIMLFILLLSARTPGYGLFCHVVQRAGIWKFSAKFSNLFC